MYINLKMECTLILEMGMNTIGNGNMHNAREMRTSKIRNETILHVSIVELKLGNHKIKMELGKAKLERE